MAGTAPGQLAPPAPVEPKGFETVDRLLSALETADHGIGTLTAHINYTKVFAIQSDEQQRGGMLYFRSAPAPEAGGPAHRQFAVTFDTLIVGSRRETIDQHYAFDGQWVVEVTPAERQFTKRQVVPPGETFDPLKIGEGPFPVPIGQKRAEILDRFEASLPDPTEGLEDANCLMLVQYHHLVELLLVPKEGSDEARDFESVRIWYQPEGHMLPLVAKTVNPTGDVSLVVLTGTAVNEPIDDNVFSTEVPPADEGWHVSISEYRKPVSE
ncbi:MAG: hypothetical protein H6810_12790 [Phycisphaeraceae bacterium]|nr:MAG: hypothetical protein H6810_12790 [Phycisphaeraceae bacterium]